MDAAARIEADVKGLLDHLAKHPCTKHAVLHYKMEEWVAVEAAAYFHQRGKVKVVGTVPYVTEARKGKDKWSDLYVGYDAPAPTNHLLFEFKAVPHGAFSRRATAIDFARDVDALSKFKQEGTRKFWTTQKNSKGRTETAWLAWTKEIPADMLAAGHFWGLAALFSKKQDAAHAKSLVARKPFYDVEQWVGSNDHWISCVAYLLSIGDGRVVSEERQAASSSVTT